MSDERRTHERNRRRRRVGTPLAQAKGTDVERAGQDLDVQQHTVRGELKADAAAGVGETDGEDHQTDDRDADGRLPWRIPASAKEGPGRRRALPRRLPLPRTPPAKAAICSTSAGEQSEPPLPSGEGQGEGDVGEMRRSRWPTFAQLPHG